MARIFDCSENNFRQNIKPVIEEPDIRREYGSTGKVKRVWYRARGVIESWAANEAAKRTPESTSDPELAGDASPALERYRAARAQLAEFELKLKQGDLMARADVHEGLSEAGAILRRKAIRLRKLFGEEAAQIIADAVEDMLRANERLFGSDDGEKEN